MSEQTEASLAAKGGNGGLPAGDVLLKVTDLVRHFPVVHGVVFRHKVGAVRAVAFADLVLHVGPSDRKIVLAGRRRCH